MALQHKKEQQNAEPQPMRKRHLCFNKMKSSRQGCYCIPVRNQVASELSIIMDNLKLGCAHWQNKAGPLARMRLAQWRGPLAGALGGGLVLAVGGGGPPCLFVGVFVLFIYSVLVGGGGGVRHRK